MIAFRLVSRVLGLASTLILARILTAADFGLVALGFSISSAINSISNIGVTEALIRTKNNDKNLLDTGFTIQLIRGCLTGIVLSLTAPLIAKWLGNDHLTLIICALAITFIITGAENIGVTSFRREMRFDKEFRLSLSERVPAFLVTISIALYYRSYWALVIGLVISKATRLVATYRMQDYRPSFTLVKWRDLAGYSLWMWLSSLVYIVWVRADPLIIGSQVTNAVLGLYVISMDVALLPATELMEPIGAVLFASFASEYNLGNDVRNKTFTLAACLILFMAPIALVISAASTDIVGLLLGSKWTAAAPIISILAFSVVLFPFSSTAAQALTATGRVRTNFLIVSCASIVKIGLLYASAYTGDPLTIATSSVMITTVEAGLFVIVLQASGGSLRAVSWPLTRIAMSLLFASGALKLSGLAWKFVEGQTFATYLRDGALVGLIGSSVYTATLLSLWYLGGRPSGPEKLCMSAIVPAVRRLWHRRKRLVGHN